jgi:hypothetical protein
VAGELSSMMMLRVPVPCWHESIHSARTDSIVALSPEGAFLQTQRPLPPGTPIFLEIVRGLQGERIEVDGQVVDGAIVGQQGFAVRFRNVDRAVTTFVDDVLQLRPYDDAALPPGAPIEKTQPFGRAVWLSPSTRSFEVPRTASQDTAGAVTPPPERLAHVAPTPPYEDVGVGAGAGTTGVLAVDFDDVLDGLGVPLQLATSQAPSSSNVDAWVSVPPRAPLPNLVRAQLPPQPPPIHATKPAPTDFDTAFDIDIDVDIEVG